MQVRRWERTLNHVSETMDVWFTVQTRWQYLEGIFSSDDIRQQLPEEARKFAAIDKTWKGVMAATKKAGRVAAEGLVGLAVASDGLSVAVVEVRVVCPALPARWSGV